MTQERSTENSIRFIQQPTNQAFAISSNYAHYRTCEYILRCGNIATNIIILYNTAPVVHLWRCLRHFLATKWRLIKLRRAPSLVSNGAILERLGKIKCLVLPRKSARPLDMRQNGGISVWFDDIFVNCNWVATRCSSTVPIYTQRYTEQHNETECPKRNIRGSYRKSWATIFFMRTGNSRWRRVRW